MSGAHPPWNAGFTLLSPSWLLSSILFLHSIREFFGEDTHHLIPFVTLSLKKCRVIGVLPAPCMENSGNPLPWAKVHSLPASRLYWGQETQQTGPECIYSLSWSPLEERSALWDCYSSEVIRIMSYNYTVITVCQPVNHRIFLACTRSYQHCLSPWEQSKENVADPVLTLVLTLHWEASRLKPHVWSSSLQKQNSTRSVILGIRVREEGAEIPGTWQGSGQ